VTAHPVTVLDYGIGNLLNVVRALEHCGGAVKVLDRSPNDRSLPDRLVLPGVGAFTDGIKELQARGFDELVKRYAATGRPFLGICVGAQVLFDVGEEFGDRAGLGLIPGRVQPVPPVDASGRPHRIPHIGWSALERPPGLANWDGSILAGQEPGQPVYFVHSFNPVPEREEHRLADTFYDGSRICAAVRRDNIFGCQFHPERSGPFGLAVLETFLRL
jgi:glutamine amidotransferase